MAVYAIGDVQGCLEPLQRLLERVGFDPARDRLWFTGDLVNRGPHSLQVLRLVRSLGDTAITVLGNHDLHLLAVARSASAPRRTHDTLDEVLRAPDRDELLDWLLHRPLMHHDPDLDFTLLHAGLPPQWDLGQALACAHEAESVLRGPDTDHYIEQMYGDEPRQWSDSLQGIERWRFTINCLTRLRYCDAGGHLHLGLKGPPEEQPSHVVPWFRVPGRASESLKVVFGHWSTLGRVADPGVVALDTGCVWGGRLTAARLDVAHQRVSISCQSA